MKIFRILATAGLLVAATAAASSAEARDWHRHHGWHGHHRGWNMGHHHGWGHCRTVWRHHHRVRVC